MYKRYIDDIFIFVDEEYFNAFSDQLNRIHKHFGHRRKKTSNSLAFLDVLMTRWPDRTTQKTIGR